MAHVVTDRHSVFTATADDEPLQKGGALTRWTVPAFRSVSLGILNEATQVLLMLGPADVSRMSIEEQRVPLLPRQLADAQTTDRFARGRATKRECACIAGTVQRVEDTRVAECSPGQLALSGTSAQSPRDELAIVTEVAHSH
jgi:hypothetical protein